jgi:hypothetical protein
MHLENQFSEMTVKKEKEEKKKSAGLTVVRDCLFCRLAFSLCLNLSYGFFKMAYHDMCF